MKLEISIQSVSDIITNSSSEVFVVEDTRSAKELEKFIRPIADSHYFKGGWDAWDKLSEEEKAKYDSSSGEGGELDIKGWEDRYEEWKSWHPENKRQFLTPEIWSYDYKEDLEELKKRIWIDIDWNRKATIKWIFENLYVVNVDSYLLYEKDPETGRILGIIPEEEWNKLPEERRGGIPW